MAAGNALLYADHVISEAKAILTTSDHQPVAGGDLSLKTVSTGNWKYLPLSENEDLQDFLPLVTFSLDPAEIDTSLSMDGVDILYPLRIVYFRGFLLTGSDGIKTVTPYTQKIQDLEFLSRPFIRATDPGHPSERSWTNTGQLQFHSCPVVEVDFEPPEEDQMRARGLLNVLAVAVSVNVRTRSIL